MTIGPKEIYELLNYRSQHILNQHIAQGLDINVADAEGNTVLHLAAVHGSYSRALFLMRNYSPNINAVNREGLTPLALATQYGSHGVVKYLIDYGASSSTSIVHRDTLLHLAVMKRDPLLLEMLLSRSGNDLYQLSHEGLTVFHYAVNIRNEQIYNRLVHAAGTTIPIILISELLMIAAENRDEVFAPIICNEENINRQDEIGRTILHHIAETNHYGHTTQTLIDLGANPNIPDGVGDTPLCYAIRSGNVEAVKILLKVSTITDINRPLNIAISTGNLEIMNMFLEHGAANGNLESVRALVENNADINYTNRDGFSPLQLAIRNGHNVVVNFLINRGADISNFSAHRYTALHIAAMNRNYDAISMLLARQTEGDYIYQTSWIYCFSLRS